MKPSTKLTLTHNEPTCNEPTHNGQQVIEKSTEIIDQASQQLLAGNSIQKLKIRCFGSPRQKAESKRVGDALVNNTVRAREEEAKAAAKVVGLSTSYQGQIAREQLVREHRVQTDAQNRKADKDLVTSVTGIFELKEGAVQKLRRLDGDVDLIATAIEYCEQMSVDAAQDLIDRNAQARRQQ